MNDCMSAQNLYLFTFGCPHQRVTWAICKFSLIYAAEMQKAALIKSTSHGPSWSCMHKLCGWLTGQPALKKRLLSVLEPTLCIMELTKDMWVLFASFFMSSNFYQLDLHNGTRVALAYLQWNIYQNRIENRTSPDSITVIGSACLLIS